MNKAIPITDSVYWVGVNDKETDIFESLWPLPNGVSYNAYLIDDEKVALIDTVKITYHDDFIEKIGMLLGDRGIDYLVINHMEPDHSGSVKALKRAYPDLQIVGNSKTADFLKGFYDIDDVK
ncbi:MAG: MBL fold metallo-hydrolase, partial [bacterium]